MARPTWRRRRPVPGWNTQPDDSLANPRPPAVPATLNLTLDDYFAAAAAIGLLAAQEHEPDADWARKWSLEFGEKMARDARRRRQRRRQP